MSVEVDYFYSDQVYQDNEIQGWVWPINLPADGRYWGLAIVPELANLAVCQLLDYWWATDNSDQFHLTAFFDVKGDRQHLDPPYIIPGGILFGVKLIRAPSV
jgi:hypothetical protein